MVYWSKRFVDAQGVIYCREILISLQMYPVNIMKKEFYFPEIKHMSFIIISSNFIISIGGCS